MPLTPNGFVHCQTVITNPTGREAMVTYGLNIILRDIDEQLAGLVHQAFTSAWKGRMDSNAVMDRTILRGGTPQAPLGAVSPPAQKQAGTASVGSAPPNCALHLRKQGVKPGRRNSGSCFVPWVLTTSDIGETGILSGSAITPLQSAANAWFESLSSDDLPMVILHSAGVSNVGPPSDVAGLSVDPIVGTQRRRVNR